MALLDGKKVVLRGREFTVPPLTLGQVRKFSEAATFDKVVPVLQGHWVPEAIDALLDIALAAIQANYPEVTRDDLLNLVDLGNGAPLFLAAMGAEKLEKSDPEAKGP